LFWLFLLAMIIVVTGPSWAATNDPGISPVMKTLSTRILTNGNVVISDQNGKVATVYPVIYTGWWVDQHGWPNEFLFKESADGDETGGIQGIARINGVAVDLKSSVENLPNGLHILYILTPRNDLEVSNVQARVSLPFEEWNGVPYQFDQTSGKVQKGLQRPSGSVSLSMGPSAIHDGLFLGVKGEGLQSVFFDEDYWRPNLVLLMTHNEPTRQPWTWKAGEEKRFDFTVTFDKPQTVPSGVRSADAGWKDCSSVLIDDFEDPARNGVPPERTNLWGTKEAVVTLNSAIGVTYNGPGADHSRASAGVTGTTGTYGYAIFQCPLSTKAWDVPFDAACHGLIGVQFWMKGDGNTYRVDVPSKAVTEGQVKGDWYGQDITPKAGVWTFYQFPFKSLTRKPSMGTETGLPEHPDGSDVLGIQFYPLNPGPFAYSLDQISFYGPCVEHCPPIKSPVPSNTPTPTKTPQYTPTPSPTHTPLPTYTPLDTPTPLPTDTPLPTYTAIPTATFTPWFKKVIPKRIVPTATPTRTFIPRARVKAPRSTPTRVNNRPTPTRIPPQPTALPKPKIKLDHLPPVDKSLNVTFSSPPANIYVTFADGPGEYTAEVVDSVGNTLEAIFEQRVVAQSDAWLEWDGLDQRGKDTLPGQYYVILFKDGKALKRISVIRESLFPK
jgi:hypothetical protein